MSDAVKITRREFCVAGGAFVLSFSMCPSFLKGADGPVLPG
jgi:hypothetical protein